MLFTEPWCLNYRNSASNEKFTYIELEAFREMCLLNIETSAEKSCGCVNERGNGVRSLDCLPKSCSRISIHGHIPGRQFFKNWRKNA